MYLDVVYFDRVGELAVFICMCFICIGFGELAACIWICFSFDGFGELATCIRMCFILMDFLS